MQKKLVILFSMIILAFIALIGQIIRINAESGDRFTRRVLGQQAYDSRTIPFRRGDILDTNHTKIATSERVYNVILDVFVMTSRDAFIEPTIAMLDEVFDLDPNEIRSIIEQRPTSRYEILVRRINYDKFLQFHEARTRDEFQLARGIWLEEDFLRTYPYDHLASSVIGFTVAGNLGNSGLEFFYNDVLNGTDGREFGFFATENQSERMLQPPVNGHSIVTTLDITLHAMIEEAVAEFNAKFASGPYRDQLGSLNTSVLVMNPNTGAILADVSYPNFNLNTPRDLTSFIPEEVLQNMDSEARLVAMQELWRNFVISDAFEPGSTTKGLTVAAGFESGALRGDEMYYCTGVRQVADHAIRCALRTGHGWQNIEQAIANSCNVALMEMAFQIGVEDFARFQSIFGFGKPTGIDLPGEASAATLMYTAETMRITDLATNSFGQNFGTTMIQLGAAFSSMINGGNFYRPHIVRQILDDSGRVVETIDPVLVRRTVSAETSERLRNYHRATLTYGTARSIDVPGFDVGGKTGTAQKLPRAAGKHLISFIGFAPVEKPEVLVYVVIDEPNIPYFEFPNFILRLSERIMNDIFPYLNVTRIAESPDLE